MYLKLIRLGWGQENPAFRQVYTTLFIPQGTPEQIRWLNDLQRISTSPELAASDAGRLVLPGRERPGPPRRCTDARAARRA